MIVISRRAAARALFLGLLSLPLAPEKCNAALIGSCTITVLSSGTIAANPAIDVLSSAQMGGSAAGVRVEAHSLLCAVLNLLDCYGLTASAPVSFLSAPAGGGDGVTFASVYRIDAGASVSGATKTPLANGTHMIGVDLIASRASGVFPAGGYQAQVTVRCE